MLARVNITAEIEGREPILLGYSIGTLLEDDVDDVERVHLGKVFERMYAEAVEEAEKRLRAIAFYEVVGEFRRPAPERGPDAPQVQGASSG